MLGILRDFENKIGKCGEETSIEKERHGGVEKEGGGKPRRTPLKKGFWTPLRLIRFSTPLRVIGLFFLYNSPQLSKPGAVLEGFRNLKRGCVLWCIFLQYVLHLPCQGPT